VQGNNCNLFRVISDHFTAGTKENHKNYLQRMVTLLNVIGTRKIPNIKLQS